MGHPILYSCKGYVVWLQQAVSTQEKLLQWQRELGHSVKRLVLRPKRGRHQPTPARGDAIPHADAALGRLGSSHPVDAGHSISLAGSIAFSAGKEEMHAALACTALFF